MAPSIYDSKRLLTPTSIRVLSIEPGERTDDIRCAFKFVDLEDAPVFEALSYVWGTDGNITTVYCDEQEVLITPNLAYALRRIRFQLSFQDTSAERRLWAHLRHHLEEFLSTEYTFVLLDVVSLMILNVTGLVTTSGLTRCVSTRLMTRKELSRWA